LSGVTTVSNFAIDVMVSAGRTDAIESVGEVDATVTVSLGKAGLLTTVSGSS